MDRRDAPFVPDQVKLDIEEEEELIPPAPVHQAAPMPQGVRAPIIRVAPAAQGADAPQQLHNQVHQFPMYPALDVNRAYPAEPIPRVLVAELVNQLWGLNIPLDPELLDAPQDPAPVPDVENIPNPFTVLGTIIRDYLVYTHEQLLRVMAPHDAREEITRIFIGEMGRLIDENIAPPDVHRAWAPALANPEPQEHLLFQNNAAVLLNVGRQRLRDIQGLFIEALNLAQEAEAMEPNPETRYIVQLLENRIRVLQEQLNV